MTGFGTREQPTPILPIVGVVADVKYASISKRLEPAVYVIGRLANRQTLVVATSGVNPSTLLPLIRASLQELNPQVPMDFALLPEIVSESLSRQRLGMLLMFLFGTAAITLAAIGVYGVFAYSISQRSREVAIRLAIGATPADMFRFTLAQAHVMSTVGVPVGVIVAYAAGRILSSALYEIKAADPLILISSVVLVALAAAVATVLPRRRAARIDPFSVLRGD